MRCRFFCCLVLCALVALFLGRATWAAGPQLIVQTGPAAPLKVTAFSPDGRLQATGEARGVVRLWDWESGAEIRRFYCGEMEVTALAFSNDSSRLLCAAGTQGSVFEVKSGEQINVNGPKGGRSARWDDKDSGFLLCGDKQTWLFDANGHRTSRINGHRGPVLDAAFSPDRSHILSGGADNLALYIDCATASIEQSFEDNDRPVNCVAISPDGNLALLGLKSRRLRFIDLKTGSQIREISTQGEPLSLRFSPDGQGFLVTVLGDATRWFGLDGSEKGRFAGFVAGADFSADGRKIATAEPYKAHLWNATDSKEVAVCQGRVAGVYGAAFSPDSQTIATAHGDGSIQLFSVSDGERRRLELSTERAICVAFSPDGLRLLAGGDRGALALFEVASGKRLFTLKGHEGSILGVGISGDGQTLLSAGQDGLLRFWNASDGAVLEGVKDHEGGTNALTVDAQGQRVVTGGADGKCTVWEIASRKMLREFTGDGSAISTVAWSPDGTQIASGSASRAKIALWDAQSGQTKGKLVGSNVWALVFSPQNLHLAPPVTSRLFVSGEDSRLYSFDAAGTRREEAVLDSCSAPLVVSPDGRWIAASGEDGLLRINALSGGRSVCVLTAFKGGDWAVVNDEGRFDTSLSGYATPADAGLLWSYELSPLGLDWARDSFRQTGLLGRLLNPATLPLSRIQKIDDPQLFPRMMITAPAATQTMARIQLFDNGGGIGPVKVSVNGKLSTEDARPMGSANGAKSLDFLYQPPENLLSPGGWNTLRVVAKNAKENLDSLPQEIRWQTVVSPGSAKRTAPRLFVLAGGISVYANSEFNLTVAAKDARDMAEAFLVAGRTLFTPERVKIRLLTGENAAEAPSPGIEHGAATKANFEAAFRKIQAEALPDDVVFLYLAGHGGVTGQGKNDYFYPTQEAKSLDVTDPRWGSWTLTDEDITGWMKTVAARKTAIVLDTCFSGNAAKSIGQARAAGVNQLRAFERLQNVSGSHILAGCALNAKSYEGTRLNQGLLTYALLEGMRGPALRHSADGQELDVAKWFDYAQHRVPDLAKIEGEVQLPQAVSPRGESFPLGVLSPSDIQKVPLRAEMLVVRRPRLRDETAGDSLGLQPLLSAALRAQATGKTCPFLFVDAPDVPGSYYLSGAYSLRDKKVFWSLQLTRDGQTLLKFEDSGSMDNIPGIVQSMVATLEFEIDHKPSLFITAPLKAP